ncbi:hypothetical protein J6590_100253 [Homalodisca vitripennis]|nr:hypothetical protein J6590_100253 [Homalodisca vitripennis]
MSLKDKDSKHTALQSASVYFFHHLLRITTNHGPGREMSLKDKDSQHTGKLFALQTC